MIGIILGVVGLAGGGGLAALIAKFGLQAVLGRTKSLFAAVPRQVWIALAVVAVLLGGYFLHQHKAHQHDAALVKSTIAQRDQEWRDALAKAHAGALASRARHEATATKISTTLKGQHDAQVRSNASDARDLQLRGPGKAAAYCGSGNHSGVPAAASRSGGAAGGASAAAGSLSADDRLALVPWSWLVDEVAKPADDSLAEVLTWRDWYAQQAAAWERMRSQTAKPQPTKGATDGR